MQISSSFANNHVASVPIESRPPRVIFLIIDAVFTQCILMIC